MVLMSVNVLLGMDSLMNQKSEAILEILLLVRSLEDNIQKRRSSLILLGWVSMIYLRHIVFLKMQRL